MDEGNRRREGEREGARHDEIEPELLFHNNPEPLSFSFTKGMVLFKHPFHLCWLPALGRDGRVEVGGERPEKKNPTTKAIKTKTSTESILHHPELPSVRRAEL